MPLSVKRSLNLSTAVTSECILTASWPARTGSRFLAPVAAAAVDLEPAPVPTTAEVQMETVLVTVLVEPDSPALVLDAAVARVVLVLTPL